MSYIELHVTENEMTRRQKKKINNTPHLLVSQLHLKLLAVQQVADPEAVADRLRAVARTYPSLGRANGLLWGKRKKNDSLQDFNFQFFPRSSCRCYIPNYHVQYHGWDTCGHYSPKSCGPLIPNGILS